MSEELHKRIKELENRNQILDSAARQWDHVHKMFLESHGKLSRSESFLKKIKERMEWALSAGDLAWWDWEYKSGMIYYNAERARLLGFSEEELPGNFNEVIQRIHQDDHDEAVAKIHAHIAGETDYYEAEYRLQSKAGEWKWFYDRGRVVEKDIMGEPVLISGVLIDINDRKVAEKELTSQRDIADASSRAKSLFLANMSHEIYTPMAGVVGMADILKQSGLADEQREYIDIIVNSASNLMSVLNDIMEFIKVENKKIDLIISPISISELLKEVEAGTFESCHEKELELLTFIDTRIPDHVMGDPRRLRQLLQIFVKNAVKFTDTGRVIISIEFAGWDEETIRIRFRISDTGIGIPEHELGQLFQSFTRLNTKIGSYGGSGLGLAIAKHLANLMNGEISVESKEGEGSTFTFTVDFDRLVEQETLLDVSMLQGKRILLVDQDATRRALLKNYLLLWDCETEECDSVEEAIELIRHHLQVKKPLDLTIIEYHSLMTSSGITFDQFSEQEWLESPHILVAPKEADVALEEIKRAGFQLMVLRPFLPGQLVEAIRNATSGKRTDFSIMGNRQFAEKSASAKKVLKILLAEDNLINQRVALVTLKKLGHDTTLAQNGKEAVSLFESGSFDLILMDILMPEMNGLEATRKIREIEDATRVDPIHICAITANISVEDEDACYESGMNSYITKPFRLEELNNILSKV
ncbi:MAG: response regulator [Bacteroidales bacterium]|nr:response regulator [Bacteroidales bacterium]